MLIVIESSMLPNYLIDRIILRIILTIIPNWGDIQNISGYYPILLFQRYSGLNLERASRLYILLNIKFPYT